MFFGIFSCELYDEAEWLDIYHLEVAALGILRESWREFATLNEEQLTQALQGALVEFEGHCQIPSVDVRDRFIAHEVGFILQGIRELQQTYGSEDIATGDSHFRPREHQIRECIAQSEPFRRRFHSRKLSAATTQRDGDGLQAKPQGSTKQLDPNSTQAIPKPPNDTRNTEED